MDITYRKEGDYYVPNIKAPEQIKGFKLEKYSGLRLQFLKEHRRGKYTYLLIENKLQSHLLEVQKNAKKEYEMLMKELKIKENITEELKEKDQMKWVGLMNNISNIADEIVIKKYVYEE